MSTTEAPTRQRRLPLAERREVDFFVRAKTGPGPRDWSPVGVAFKRRNGDGYSVKLNTLPIDMAAFRGVLVLVPPFVEEGAEIEE